MITNKKHLETFQQKWNFTNILHFACIQEIIEICFVIGLVVYKVIYFVIYLVTKITLKIYYFFPTKLRGVLVLDL